MRNLPAPQPSALTEGFKWRSKDGSLHSPGDMTTDHLWFTLRMIWNHTMPEPARVYPFKSYRFGEFYTREYMLLAVRELAKELSTRKMSHLCQRELIKMMEWLSTLQLANEQKGSLT